MTKYNVHIYREMRLKFDDIEADSLEEAAQKAHDMHFDDSDDWSDCEGETLSALVDVQGDKEYELSRVIDFEPGRHLKTAGKVLDALKDLLGDLPAVQNGECVWCGRDYRDPDDTVPDGDCLCDDCPSSIARVAITAAEGS